MPEDFPRSQDMRPAARDQLAAAGPVEPSSSPGVAPGPTFSLPTTSSDEQAGHRKTAEFEDHAGIAGAILIASDIAWRWLDPPAGEGNVPTLVFVPGIVISGRYRMLSPS
jgi:hypothetical protein